MTQETNKPHGFEVVQLEGGKTAYVLTPTQLEALAGVLDDRMWWNGLWTRVKRVSGLVAALVVILAFLASSWPWITNLAKWIVEKEGGQ